MPLSRMLDIHYRDERIIGLCDLIELDEAKTYTLKVTINGEVDETSKST